MASNLITAISFLVALNIVLDAKSFTLADKKVIYVHYSQDNLGNYNCWYNDTIMLAIRAEIGTVGNSTSDAANLVVKGSYENSFQHGDCQEIVVTYEADENGYKPKFIYKEKGQSIDGTFVSLCRHKYRNAEPMSRDITSACLNSLCGPG